MNFTILRENFKKTVGLIERASGKNTHLPILENILLTTQNHKLMCVCTDLEIAIKMYCPAKIKTEGSACIPVKLLSYLLQTMEGEKCTVEQKERIVKISSETQKSIIKTSSPEEYPIIPDTVKKQPLAVQKEDFLHGLQQITGISSISELKPELTGVYIQKQKDELKLVATDTFRLAEKTIPIYSPTNDTCSFIIPTKTVNELISLLNGRKGLVEMFLEPNQILFEERDIEEHHPQFQLISRLIEGEFPAYSEVIPMKLQTQTRFKKEELLNHIRAAGLFSSRIHDVHLSFRPKEKKCDIFTKNYDCGEYASSVYMDGQGEPLEAVFNWRFLVDGLHRIESAEVIFQQNEGQGPAILRPVGDTSFFYVVMPIRNQ